MENIYDLVIIGGGPAGLSAAIYALRGGLDILLIESDFLGGEVNKTFEVDNYPAFPKKSGFELMQDMSAHAINLGLKTKTAKVVAIKNEESKVKSVCLENGETISAKTILLACGAKPRRLGLEGEERLTGAGISYCAVCDGALYKGADVVVVGGGNTAMENAIYLSALANKVYVLNRSSNFKADSILLNEARSKSNVVIIENAIVTKLKGDKQLEEVEYKCGTGTHLVKAQGLFVSIGKVADTSLLPNAKKDEFGFIVTDEDMQTSLCGIYAAGDIRAKKVKQIITACSDGAIAALSAMKYVKNN